MAESDALPPRIRRPGLAPALVFAAFMALIAASLSGSGLTLHNLIGDIGNLGVVIDDMLPPETDRLHPMLWYAWVTVQMAVVGTVLGVLVSLPLSFFASARHTPHASIHAATRGLIAFFRSVPDLVWALLFIPWVGLGPAAGTLAIAVDTVGFCGRFFAEHLEEGEQGPAEALRCIGAGRVDVLCAATIPAALPSMTNTTLYAFEKAIRSSMILGLVGAGGIGVELTVAMDMFRYGQASTIILIIFCIVLVVEQSSSWIRQRLLRISE
ncbi:MAG: phosphonate ABC transporter, permease protein PhnE [Planctomycetota bacterium]